MKIDYDIDEIDEGEHVMHAKDVSVLDDEEGVVLQEGRMESAFRQKIKNR